MAMIRAILIFSAGVYAGVYAAQNYQIDKVEDPKVLFEKAHAFIKAKMAEYSGDKGGKKGD